MNRLTEIQVSRNAAARSNWEHARTHRQRVTAEIADAAGDPGGRLCVLGAGNCTDLDLPSLSNRFSEVHLVDLDAQALQEGCRRQGVADHSSIVCHGGTDVTGVWDELDRAIHAAAAEAPDVESFCRTAQVPPSAVPHGAFDHVASVCLLSQLIEGVVWAFGERHPKLPEAVRAIRHGHLKLLTGLMAPGGTGLLVTDIVSSDTAPALLSADERELASLVPQWINQRNFFHGTNPVAIASVLKSHPLPATDLTQVDIIGPWRWRLGARAFAVAAVRLQKAACRSLAPESSGADRPSAEHD